MFRERVVFQCVKSVDLGIRLVGYGLYKPSLWTTFQFFDIGSHDNTITIANAFYLNADIR